MITDIVFFLHGSPEKVEDIPFYLKNILKDRMRDEILSQYVKKYQLSGGFSPNMQETKKQINLMEKLLREKYRVESKIHLVTRFYKPSPQDIFPKLEGKKILLFISTLIQCRETMSPYLSIVEKYNISFTLPPPLHRNEKILQYFSERAKNFNSENAHFIFTAHSVPLSPYSEEYRMEFFEFSSSIARSAGITHFSTFFQSIPPSGKNWLGPHLFCFFSQKKSLEGKKLVFMNLNFLTENIETLYDLDYEVKNLSEFNNFFYSRIPQPGADEKFIDVLVEHMMEAL